MTDTHCHLTFLQYETDRAAVLERARAAGVARIVNPGTDVAQSRAAVRLASAEAEIFAAVGVHPQDVGELSEESFAELSALARSPRVVAIGEVGLEQSSRTPALVLQRRWLERFVRLAADVGKPLIFHVRDAHAEFRSFLEKVWGPAPPKLQQERRGVVHCFSGTLDDAQRYAAQGLLLGITGIVTFPNAEVLRSVVREIPLERLLLETDAPFLAPQSHRGQRNEPAFLPETAAKVAELKGVSLTEVERVTDENARRLFGTPLSSRGQPCGGLAKDLDRLEGRDPSLCSG